MIDFDSIRSTILKFRGTSEPLTPNSLLHGARGEHQLALRFTYNMVRPCDFRFESFNRIHQVRRRDEEAEAGAAVDTSSTASKDEAQFSLRIYDLL